MIKPLFPQTPLKGAVVAFLTASFFITQAQAAPRGEELLRDAMKAQRTVSYVATETTTRIGAPTMIARVQKSGDKRRLEYSAPAIMRGDLLLDDGANLWRYHRAEKSAIKTKTATRQKEPSQNALRLLAVSAPARSTLVGRKAWLVTVSTRNKKRVLHKIWIDEKTKARLRMERFDNRGQRVETVALSNIKFGAVPTSAFRWTTPAGARLTNAGTLYQQLGQAQRSTRWLQAPSKLPKGYVFENAVVNSSDAWLRYSNGVRRFSIFQQRTKDARSTPFKRAGSAWYWQKSGNRFLIAGLPEAQAKLIANSVR